MKKINKGIEPITLTNYRSSISNENLKDSNIYDDFKYKTRKGCINGEKGNLRKQLLEEQGYICCYCMSRIDCNNSKIEHYKDQSINRSLQIYYQNLFISCNGNEGKSLNNQHCDTKKGSNALSYITLLNNIERNLKYRKNDKDGVLIYSDDKNINRECNDILNLNYRVLKKSRRTAYDSVIAKIIKKNYKTSAIRRVIEHYKEKHNTGFEPYCEMIVYFLTRKLQSKGVS